MRRWPRDWWGVLLTVGVVSLALVLIELRDWIPNVEMAGITTGIVAIFTVLLWKTNRDLSKIQEQLQKTQTDFNEWTKRQYQPAPDIVGGLLQYNKTATPPELIVKVDMVNMGLGMLFYKATRLNDCTIGQFFKENEFANNVTIKPYESVEVSLTSPVAGDQSELDKLLGQPEGSQVLIDITEQYYSGRKLREQHVWDIAFRKNDKGEWRIAPAFASTSG